VKLFSISIFDNVFTLWTKASGSSFETIKSNFKFDELFDAVEGSEIDDKNFRAEISLRNNLNDFEFYNAW
jgi:hypothetical protein